MHEFIHRHRRSTIPVADMLPDTYDDVLGQKLARLQHLQRTQTGWTAQKAQLRHDLEVMSPYFGYVRIWVDHRDYSLFRVGQSYQYDVPPDKRGHLARFRGIRVRLMCLYGSTYHKGIRVGPANPLDTLSDGPRIDRRSP